MILHSDLVVKTIEKGIYLFQDLCLESLGLDITSVIFKSFQNGSNISFFVISFCQRIIRMVDSCVIHLPFELEIFSNRTFSVYVSKIYLRSCSNLLIDTNPRLLPLKKNLSTRAPSCTILHHPPKKKRGFQRNRTNDVEPRALSFLYNI